MASAPIECLISILYWGLRAVSAFPKIKPSYYPSSQIQKLILTPHQIDTSLVLPPWAPILLLRDDFSFHLIPALSLVLDLLYFSPPYTIAVLPALGLSACIAFGYWFWIEQCYAYNQFYPYPIFDVLSTAGRVGLFAGSAGLMALATGGLVWVYGVVNGREARGARSGNVKGE